MDWLQNVVWCNPAKVHSRLSENIQNIRRSHKIHQGCHKKLERGINSWKTNLNRDENLKKHFPGWYTFAVNIFDSINVTQLYA